MWSPPEGTAQLLSENLAHSTVNMLKDLFFLNIWFESVKFSNTQVLKL
jgi:hypothetical protein